MGEWEVERRVGEWREGGGGEWRRGWGSGSGEEGGN